MALIREADPSTTALTRSKNNGMTESKRQIQSYSKRKMVEIVQKVCELYSLGNYTLESVCENAGVPYRTFKHWWSMYEKEGSKVGSKWAILAEVADLWAASQTENKEVRERELVERAERMLLKRVQGFHYEENETIYRTHKDKSALIPVGIKKIQKYSPPSDRAIRFVLTKLCPEKYGDFVMQMKIPEPVDKDNYRNWTMEELDRELERAKQNLKISEARQEYEDEY